MHICMRVNVCVRLYACVALFPFLYKGKQKHTTMTNAAGWDSSKKKQQRQSELCMHVCVCVCEEVTGDKDIKTKEMKIF